MKDKMNAEIKKLFIKSCYNGLADDITELLSQYINKNCEDLSDFYDVILNDSRAWIYIMNDIMIEAGIKIYKKNERPVKIFIYRLMKFNDKTLSEMVPSFNMSDPFILSDYNKAVLIEYITYWVLYRICTTNLDNRLNSIYYNKTKHKGDQ